MSVLVVGVSHRSAPMSVLEDVARDREGAAKLIRDVIDSDHVAEATVVATCNRVEVYAEVERFHGSVEEISAKLLGSSAAVDKLLPHLYVHYDEGAVSHLFHVAAGLDSMVVGESQVLGQTRDALRLGQESGSVGPALNSLFQQALRVGKRSHAETEIGKLGPSIVSRALDAATEHIGDLTGRKAVVVGAGSMAGLSCATLRRAGVGELVVVNRTAANAQRLAESYDGTARDLSDLSEVLADAEVLVCCTGSAATVVWPEHIGANRSLAVLDLALPHDVDPAVGELDGVTLIGLADLSSDPDGEAGVAEVREIVAGELATYLSLRRAASVTPTVVALRTMASGVVEGELERLFARLGELDEVTRAEVENTVRRVADKLLHKPTTRVKELADTDAVSYASALAELFALDPEAVQAVTRVEGRS